jgi:predicted nuclease of predicted toxin-antitoxin system
MVIIADENIDHRLIEILREYFEVISIYESFRGATDLEIVSMARQKVAMIITEDKDFGEIVFTNEYEHLTVILLRYTFKDKAKFYEVLSVLLQHQALALIGKFTTITPDKIRIREL